MAEANDQDQSMEEILQSIKRIIADEEEDEPTQASEPQISAPAVSSEPTEASESTDVLELTELVQEDGTVTNLDEETEAAAQPAAQPPEAPAAPAVAFEEEDADALISANVAQASADALSSLLNQPEAPKTPPATASTPAFRSGATVEDLAVEALKPMLKEWLDANLQQIVERIVEREVRRISGQ